MASGGAGDGERVKQFLVLSVPPAEDSDQRLAGASYDHSVPHVSVVCVYS